jgi:hypothetical protein
MLVKDVPQPLSMETIAQRVGKNQMLMIFKSPDNIIEQELRKSIGVRGELAKALKKYPPI